MRPERPPYYIGAYEIAVRNGYRGTREEFGRELARGATAASAAEEALAAAQEAMEAAQAAGASADASAQSAGSYAAAAETAAQESEAASDAAAAAARTAESSAGLLAPEFVATDRYGAGDFVLYGGQLYIFTAEHLGPWTGLDAEATTVTAHLRSPLAAGDGVEIEDGVISLPEAYYDFLEEATYRAPTVAAFAVEGLGGAAEIGSSVTVSGLTHRETNLENIVPGWAAGLGLWLDGNSVVRAIPPAAELTSVSFSGVTVDWPLSTPGSRTLSLVGADTRGRSFSASVSKRFYVPKFLGATVFDSLLGPEVPDFSRGEDFPDSITTEETSYLWFVTDGTVSSVKDADTGFGVPLEGAVRVSVYVNGVGKSYNAYRTSNRITAGTYRFTVS